MPSAGAHAAVAHIRWSVCIGVRKKQRASVPSLTERRRTSVPHDRIDAPQVWTSVVMEERMPFDEVRPMRLCGMATLSAPFYMCGFAQE